jgi:hypothetical protein
VLLLVHSVLCKNNVAAILLLLIAKCIVAQAAPGPKLNIFVPASIASESLEVHYYLYGSFGAFGGFIKAKPDSEFIEIPLLVKGKPANEIKLFAWAPGCKIETFDIYLKALDVRESYSCNSLLGIPLVGQLSDTSLLRQKPAEIRVDYFAGWACDFFGLPDCMVPQISLGTTKIKMDGSFEIDLPDFAADPAVLNSRFDSEFQVALREVKTWNLVAFLSPELTTMRTPGGALKPTLSYPQPTVFIARKIK